MTYTVVEIAAKCGVTPRAIRAFCAKEDIGSIVGRTRKLTEAEAEAVIRHYAEIASDIPEDVEAVSEDTEANAEEVEAVPEDVPQADFSETVKQLEKRIQEKEEEINFLRKQVEGQAKTIDSLTENVGRLTEQNQALTIENAAFASRLLNPPREEEEETEDEAEVVDAETDLQGEEPAEEQKPQGFLEWLKSLFS